jgi:hypothetical protein
VHVQALVRAGSVGRNPSPDEWNQPEGFRVSIK